MKALLLVLVASCYRDEPATTTPPPAAPVVRDAAPSPVSELEAKLRPVFAAVAGLDVHDCARLATQLRQFGADHAVEDALDVAGFVRKRTAPP